jgi:Ser-tRNA(Ala) deacylase AlaX
VSKPIADGGTLERKGVSEVVSSIDREGRDVPHHLAMGTYVVAVRVRREVERAFGRPLQ